LSAAAPTPAQHFTTDPIGRRRVLRAGEYWIRRLGTDARKFLGYLASTEATHVKF